MTLLRYVIPEEGDRLNQPQPEVHSNPAMKKFSCGRLRKRESRLQSFDFCSLSQEWRRTDQTEWLFTYGTTSHVYIGSFYDERHEGEIMERRAARAAFVPPKEVTDQIIDPKLRAQLYYLRIIPTLCYAAAGAPKLQSRREQHAQSARTISSENKPAHSTLDWDAKFRFKKPMPSSESREYIKLYRNTDGPATYLDEQWADVFVAKVNQLHIEICRSWSATSERHHTQNRSWMTIARSRNE